MNQNDVYLRGYIRDIQPSHTINDIEFYKASVVSQRQDGKEDLINIKFKRFANTYENNAQIELKGNLRSYSHLVNGKNKVDLYVFTYFDRPDIDMENSNNTAYITGRVCRIDDMRKMNDGKNNIHFTVANNLISESNQKLNSYIPCVAWGKLAREISKLHINDKLKLVGEIHSREYKKFVSPNSDEFEIKVAHELLVKSFEIIDDEA